MTNDTSPFQTNRSEPDEDGVYHLGDVPDPELIGPLEPDGNNPDHPHIDIQERFDAFIAMYIPNPRVRVEEKGAETAGKISEIGERLMDWVKTTLRHLDV